MVYVTVVIEAESDTQVRSASRSSFIHQPLAVLKSLHAGLSSLLANID